MAQPNADGTFSVPLTIPESAPPGREVKILAILGNGSSVDASFTITQSDQGSGGPKQPSDGPSQQQYLGDQQPIKPHKPVEQPDSGGKSSEQDPSGENPQQKQIGGSGGQQEQPRKTSGWLGQLIKLLPWNPFQQPPGESGSKGPSSGGKSSPEQPSGGERVSDLNPGGGSPNQPKLQPDLPPSKVSEPSAELQLLFAREKQLEWQLLEDIGRFVFDPEYMARAGRKFMFDGTIAIVCGIALYTRNPELAYDCAEGIRFSEEQSFQYGDMTPRQRETLERIRQLREQLRETRELIRQLSLWAWVSLVTISAVGGALVVSLLTEQAESSVDKGEQLVTEFYLKRCHFRLIAKTSRDANKSGTIKSRGKVSR